MTGIQDGLVQIIEEVLEGIDKDECESANGWFETSMGAKFGAERKAALKEAVLARVEAEIARLREDAQDNTAAIEAAEASVRKHERHIDTLLARAEAAEAEIARLEAIRLPYTLREAWQRVETLEAEIARRDEQIAELQKEIDGMARAPYGEYQKMRERMEAAEGRETRLKDGLRRIAMYPYGGDPGVRGIKVMARALLAEEKS